MGKKNRRVRTINPETRLSVYRDGDMYFVEIENSLNSPPSTERIGPFRSWEVYEYVMLRAMRWHRGDEGYVLDPCLLSISPHIVIDGKEIGDELERRERNRSSATLDPHL